MGLVGVGAGRLADLLDPRLPIVLGLLLQVAAMYYLGLTSILTTSASMTGLIIIYRMSFGCVYTPLTSVVLNTLPRGRLSMGSGLDGIHRGFGSAFGIAVGSTVLELRVLTHLINLREQHELSTLSVREASGELAQLLAQAGDLGGTAAAKALFILREHLLQQAETAAYQDTFLLLCAITLLALLPAMLSRGRREDFGKQSNG